MHLARIEKRNFKFLTMDAQRGDICYIVVHHSAGAVCADTVHEMHKANKWAGIGYHFFIEPPKTDEDFPLIVAGRPLCAVGAHCYGHNVGTVGICFGGNYIDKLPSAEMLMTGILLLTELCIILDINPAVGIVAHSDFAATACPAKIKDALPEIKKFVAELTDRNEIRAAVGVQSLEELEALEHIGASPLAIMNEIREAVMNCFT